MSQPDASVANGVILDLGEGLTVREYRLSDVKTLSYHANNKKLWLQLRDRFPHPYTEESAVTWINRCRSEGNCVRSGPWTYEDGASGPLTYTHYAIAINDEACGSIGLDFGSAELGYWLSEEHWGKGVMSRIAPAFVEWSWATFGILARINAEVVEENLASAKLLQKCGLKIEGRCERKICKDGVFKNALILGALRP
ncbi:hypothetical protein CERZMDRAFT_94999 [Cercospora zeae-maydis SCOH1-5]|uniref:N-acetyltransferase domain-containing protein n=1 Tax=Cercospora zeae-maydis SCOH1-5 TaxID=717836 RepID=A0A6A6FM96_9PEZI|nr:hypothetical protein CERZMDRAFT_94999 [Cercospora zeae-maydis SCOH1-5]